VYLLVFGTPTETREVFSNLGVISPREEMVLVQSTTTPSTSAQLALSGLDLQQLTTRAVAGFGFASSSESVVLYAETGTGHIYEINLDTGIETQISLTTFPQTVNALFSPSGSMVALISYLGYKQEVVAGKINKVNSKVETIDLPLDAKNISFIDETNIFFTIQNENGTIGYVYDFEKALTSELFSTQVIDAKVWSDPVTKKIFLQTKPTKYQKGYLYTISKNKLEPITQPELGLTSFSQGSSTILSYIVDGQYISEWLNGGESTPQGMLLLEDKCYFETITSLYCAGPLTQATENYLENWYKGTESSVDYLWHVELEDQKATLIVDLSELSGRTIDVVDVKLTPRLDTLLFKNKIDQSLWLYRIKK
jgi:hypothetical protein